MYFLRDKAKRHLKVASIRRQKNLLLFLLHDMFGLIQIIGPDMNKTAA
jgi:hypothetical protein